MIPPTAPQGPVSPQGPTQQGPSPQDPTRVRTLLDSALDEQKQTSEQSLTATFRAAVQADPNTAGRAAAVARKLGVDPERLTDADQLKIAEQLTAENELLSFYSQNPRLERVMRDLPTVRMLRDDTGNLKQISDTFDWWRRNYETGAAINEGGYLKSQGAFRDLSEDEQKRLSELHDIETLSTGDTGVFPQFAQLIGQLVKPTIGATGIGGAAAGLAALVNPAAAGAAFAWAAGSAWFAHSAVVEFGHEYETIHDGIRDALIAKGVAPAEATAQAASLARVTAGGYALSAAALEVFAEALLARPFVGAAKALTKPGISQITRASARMTAVKEIVGGLAGESVTEGVQELASSAAENIAGSISGTDFGPTVGEAVGRAAAVTWQMAQGMLVLAPIGPILHYNLDSGRVEKATQARQVFDRIAKAAQESQVLVRDAETFAEVVTAQAQGGPTNVYIEGSKLAAGLEQAGVSRDALKASLPDVARQLEESEATGGDSDVTIPMGTFAAHIAGSELYQHLADNLRLEKDGFSKAQADEWLKERDLLRAEAQTAVERSKAEISDWNQQLDDVETRIAAEVAASPKLDKSDAAFVAKLHRQFVEVNAARLGLSPREFDEKYRLAFSFRDNPAANTLRQSMTDPQDLFVQHNLTVENLLHADELGGLAAPSLAVAHPGNPLEGFGDITLIGTPAMVDPMTGAATFAGDAYTSRFPEIAHDRVTQRMLDPWFKAIEQSIGPVSPKVQDLSTVGFFHELLANARSGDRSAFIRALRQAPAGQLAFLRSAGWTGEIPTDTPYLRAQASSDPVFVAWAMAHMDTLHKAGNVRGEAERTSSAELRELTKQVRESHERVLQETFPQGAPYTLQTMDSAMDTDGLLAFGEVDRILSDIQNMRSGRRLVNVSAIHQLVAEHGGSDALYAWAAEAARPLFKNPRVRLRGRLEPATLENIVEAMVGSGRIRGREHGATHGPGAAKAATIKKFRRLSDIQNARTSISASPESHTYAAKQVEHLVSAFRDAAVRNNMDRNRDTWEILDDSMRVLGAIGKFARPSEERIVGILRSYKFDAKPGVVQMAQKAAAALRAAPVEYFESKPQRAVRLSEFKAAIVPAGAPPAVHEILAKHGVPVTVYTRGQRDAAIEAAVHSQSGLLFQATPTYFFSALRNAVETVPNESLTADAWRQVIRGLIAKGAVKEREVFWTGLDEFLQRITPVTTPLEKIKKSSVLAYLDNAGVQVVVSSLQGDRSRGKWGVFDSDGNRLSQASSKEEAQAYAEVLARADAEEQFNYDNFVYDEEVNRYFLSYDGTIHPNEDYYSEDDLDAAEAELARVREREVQHLRNLGWSDAEVAAAVQRVFLEKKRGTEWRLVGASVDESERYDTEAEANEAFDEARDRYLDRHSSFLTSNYDVAPDGGGQEGVYEGSYVIGGAREHYVEAAITWGNPDRVLFDAYDFGHTFGDPSVDENRLAHLRYSIRVDADGKQVMLLEEVQSDWADSLREGSPTPEGDAATADYATKLRQLRERLMELKVARRDAAKGLPPGGTPMSGETRQYFEKLNLDLRALEYEVYKLENSVATAPFIASADHWIALALKTALLRAVINENVDTVAIATGYQTAAVYGGLSTVVHNVRWSPVSDAAVAFGNRDIELRPVIKDPIHLTVDGHGRLVGSVFINGRNVAPFTTLQSIVGKELSDRIMAEPEGDLRLDSEHEINVAGLPGMLAFYGDTKGYARDRALHVREQNGKPILAILPKVLRDLAKKIPGAEFSTVELPTTAASRPQEGPNTHVQLAVKLSPEAVTKIREGFPLFQPARGAFDPQTGTAFLMQEHDASTFLHETSHYWLSTIMRAASDPQADTDMREDAQALLSWFGVKDIDTWNAISLEQQRPHHEAFAYNAEIYLHENKTPANNAPLRRMFRAFAQWLRRVYREIRTQLNETYRQQFGRDLPALTPEVRAVYDRMLASEDAILAQEEARGLEPLFRERPAGMSDADWTAYQNVRDEAHNSAVDKLTSDSLRQMRWLRNAKGAVLREIQKETRAARARIETEERVAAEHAPVNVARRALLKGESLEADGAVVPAPVPKINLEDARRLLAERGIEGGVKALLRGMTAEDGVSADSLAEMFGFQSGSDLVHALATAPTLEEDVQTRTDQRMLREHGDLTDPAQVTDRVEKALHNQARTKMVAAELRFLANVTSPIQVMLRAARSVAREIVGKELAGNVSPRDHSLAEIRARKDTDKLRKKGDTVGAARAKRRELLESQAVREAIEARSEIDALQKLVRRMFRPDEKLATTRNTDYVNAGRSLAAAFGLQPGEVSSVQFVRQLQAYNPQLFEQLAPVFERAKLWEEEARRQGRDVKTWKDLTVDEFRDLHDAIRALWTLSRSEREFEIAGEREELEAVATAVGEQARETAGKVPDPTLGAKTAGEKRARGWNRVWLLATRIEHWCFRKDGGAAGAFTKYVWRPVRSAVDTFVADQTVYTKRVAALVRDIAPKLKRGLIEFRDATGKRVIYTFGRGNGGFGAWELLGAILHTGNESNLRKLLVGREWGKIDEETGDLDASQWRTFVKGAIDQGYITKDVMDFVQAVWDLNEELKPLAQKAHRRLFGYYFREVEATPVETPWGTYRGGYMPAKVDSDARSAPRIKSLEELERDFRKQFASTGRGFTRTRVENFAEPLSLDLNLVPAHIDDVLRFAHLQPAVHQASLLLKHSAVADVLQASQPEVWNRMLLPWLQRVASQSATKAGMSPDIDGIWRAVRKSVGMSMMFANVANALQQFTGVFLAALRVRPKFLMRGLWALLSERTAELNDIAQLSPFMAHRQDGQIFDSVEAVRSLTQDETKLQHVRGWISRHAYFLQTAFQNVVDAVVWRGAYEQAIEAAGMATSDEAVRTEAVAQADAAVRMTQSSFDPTDVANYEEGTPFYKLFTQFSGYFNTVANLHADEFARIARATGFEKAGRAFQLYLLGFAMPMLIADAITRTMRGTWDDEDGDGSVDVFTLDFLFLGQIRSALAEIPVAGPAIVNPLLGAFDNKPWNDRMLSSPAVSLLERSGGGTIRTLKGLVAGKPLSGRDVRDVMTALGLLFGLPGGAVGSRAGYLLDTAEGAVQPSGPLDVGRALLGGATK